MTQTLLPNKILTFPPTSLCTKAQVRETVRAVTDSMILFSLEGKFAKSLLVYLHLNPQNTVWNRKKNEDICMFDIHRSVHLQYVPKVQPTRCYVFSVLFISTKRSTCFRRFLCPSSAAQTLSTASGICQTA
jgi:hypothetical protein